jgi:hypothetical protein
MKKTNLDTKIAGAVLLGFSGLISAIDVVSTRLSNAIVLSGFYAGNRTGQVPPGPAEVSSQWIILASVIVLAIIGLYLLIVPQKEV